MGRVGAPQRKRHLAGTHRVCTPEETLERILPLLPAAGITRVADLTRLDRIGIPVYQAVRPNSRNLSVSQGKGITPALAKVSAIMESLELWHAEEVRLPTVRARLREMLPYLPYDPYRLKLYDHHFLHPGLMIEWVPAFTLPSHTPTYVPKELVELDFTPRLRYSPPVFYATSNGLASGNVPVEAILHGLYEIVERDALARWQQQGWPPDRFVDPATVDGPEARKLLDQYAAAGVHVVIVDATGPTGLPCFHVSIFTDDLPAVFSGSGCHLDKEVALCRALTEAAQTRLTVIAGVRDDLSDQYYLWARPARQGPVTEPRLPESTPRDYRSLPSAAGSDLEEDLALCVSRVQAHTGFPPLVVDLTREEIGIPVTFVIGPGLLLAGE